MNVRVVNTRPEHFPGIAAICLAIYPDSPPWTREQLSSHLAVFPEGQFVAIDEDESDPVERVVGMAASLIVLWDDYSMETSWRDFTKHGTFVNHDPKHGRTLYGAEVMVHPRVQGRGIGKLLYIARRELVERLGLLRIRAGARLCGYHRFAPAMSPEAYTTKVVRGELDDATLSFQLKQGFQVLGVARNYLRNDPQSLGHAAVIEWINARVAKPADYAGRDPRYV
ncbi:MAG TPA: GNAT family N-acetyltransferase [Vicinamibacterales bacterium]|nr:GNAT family N-acetyltransferase [Vicinamibacterales bacterium]